MLLVTESKILTDLWLLRNAGRVQYPVSDICHNHLIISAIQQKKKLLLRELESVCKHIPNFFIYFMKPKGIQLSCYDCLLLKLVESMELNYTTHRNIRSMKISNMNIMFTNRIEPMVSSEELILKFLLLMQRLP